MSLSDENRVLKEQIGSLITLTSTLNDQQKKHENELKNNAVLINCLQEELKLARIKKYARSSESLDTEDAQDSLFNEAEEIAQELPAEEDKTTVQAHSRKLNRGKRKPLPSYLPRERIEYRIPDEQLQLPNGDKYVEIGTEVSEKLDVVPASVKVIEHVRYKYAVKGKEELGVIMAYMRTQAIPKSIASSGLLAHIVQSKFCHHLPLYRQESIWNGFDVDINRSSMSRWMTSLGVSAQPIVDDIMEQIKHKSYVQADETPVTVVNDINKKEDRASHQGYMWVYNNHAGVVYDYQSSRSGKHPEEKLSEFSGYVQTDAYAGYNGLFTANSNRISVGCWAHGRRKFVDVIKVSGANGKKGYADKIVAQIRKLYAIEGDLTQRKLSAIEIAKARQERASPILLDIRKILDAIVVHVPPKSLLGKAVSYTLNNWNELNRYVEHGDIPIDNNATERKIKSFAVGRKNWLFAANTKGAKASANLFTLIENAKLYNLNIFDYLKYVFDRIGNAKTDRDFEHLTPAFAKDHVRKTKNIINEKQKVLPLKL